MNSKRLEYRVRGRAKQLYNVTGVSPVFDATDSMDQGDEHGYARQECNLYDEVFGVVS
jgi:hypothetical protein